MMTLKNWQDEYKSIICKGVDGTDSYVRLARKETEYGKFRLTFRPIFVRMTERLSVFGGKLSVFFDERKVSSIDNVSKQWLLEAWPKFEFPKQDATRVGLNLISPMVTDESGLEFFKDFSESSVCSDLMTYLEQEGEFAIEDRELVIAALKQAYESMIVSYFPKLLALSKADALGKVVSGEVSDDNVIPVDFSKTLQ